MLHNPNRLYSRLCGWVAQRLRERLGFPLQELALANLRKAGLRPRVIFDVGASDGSFSEAALRIWPDAVVHCFEPEPEYAPGLEARARADAYWRYCGALVGAAPSMAQTYYHLLGGSTVMTEHSDEPGDPVVTCGPPRTGPMVTLAGYCAGEGVVPDLLKIDVQGYEMEVLKGAEPILGGVEVILSEVNHTELFRGVPLAADLIGWLSQRGYALHDVCGLLRRQDGVLWQSDMIFARHDCAIRSRRRI